MSKKKIILSVISANLYLPLLAAGFPFGYIVSVVFLFIGLLHISFFSINTDKLWKHILLSLNIIVSHFAGCKANFCLYAIFINSDEIPAFISAYIAVISVQVLLIALIVTIVVRSLDTKKKKTSPVKQSD